MIPPERVADAEYAKRRVLATVTETRFGSFVHDAAHADRAAATQLVDAELPSEPRGRAGVTEDTAVEALLDCLDSLYERHSLAHRVVSGVDHETFTRLAPALRGRGYERELYWALVPTLHEGAACLSGVRIEAKAHGSEDARQVHEAVGRDPGAVSYAADVAQALDGTELVGYRDGEPVGVAGWYTDGEGAAAVARYTHVGTRPDVSGEGIGSTLVSAVVERCPLTPGQQVVCATEPNTGFYEGLGFTRNTLLWRFAKLP